MKADSPVRYFVLALLLGLLSALVFRWWQLPLPWLLGPLITVAALRLVGVPLWAPAWLRQGGQWIVGIALGLYFTPQVVGNMVALWWVLLLGMVFAWALSLGMAMVLRRAGLDPVTAFFASTLGGAAEMVTIAESRGAQVGVVAGIHSLRVLIVVVSLPFIYKALALHGTDVYSQATQLISWPGLASLMLATALSGAMMRWLAWPNAWMLGPLLVTALITAADYSLTALPAPLIWMAQLAIGISLGVRFSPESMRQLKSIFWLLIPLTVAALSLSALFALVVAQLTGLPVATMILATSPGGIAEMSLTAKVLQLGVPVVTVFHVCRLVFVLLSAGFVYSTLAARSDWSVPQTGGVSDVK